MKSMKVSDLVFDDKLISMRPINAFFVSRYRQAYRSGATLPTIVVDENNRIVSGNHRATALLEEYGKSHTIKVQPRKFQNEREVLAFFTRENATHGNPLNTISKKRLTAALMDQGATMEEIAVLFNVTVKRVEAWGKDTVFLTVGNRKTKLVPVKNGPQFPPEKQTMTPAQYREHIQADRGIRPVPMIHQITRWLTNGWIEASDENIAAIDALSSAIVAWSERLEVAVG